MKKEKIAQLERFLSTSKKIVLVSHKNPDGDAIGSSLALAIFLKKFKHDVQVIVPNDFPEFLKWMPQSDSILNYEKQTQKANEHIAAADLIFTLDFNSLARVGDMQQVLEQSSAVFAMIDHHQQPDDYATYVYSDVNSCSTAEMVYHFIAQLGKVDAIDADIATNLYTGIMTDTGSFRFRSTTSTTHRVTADLIDKGADNASIHQEVFDTNSPQRMQLLGLALQNLKILPEYRTAYITLSQKELDKHNYQKGDTEGFVNYALSLKGVVFAAIFIESKQEGIIKMSFRSKGDFSVNQFARNHFEGGGHTNASGGKSNASLKDTVSHFISNLQLYKNELHHED